MMNEGLLSEVEALYREGLLRDKTTAAQAIGYKELLTYINGEKTLIDAIEDLKIATRRYAKRQMTWFNSHGNVHWLIADGRELSSLADEAESIIKS